ncbi:MAG: RIP metalloprotease RseP [Clostridia bacterium]|nr:RIP metalloprotease RseP [Clostridia bacterium]
MLHLIFTIVKLLIALTIVASIHELGHFLLAKLFKTGVNEFSIGFGPKIMQRKRKDTMYSLRWLPLGGYVSIEGEGTDSKRADSFNNKNTFQKIVILLAGATFNAILAVIIFLSISMAFPTYTNEITSFSKNSLLQQNGLQVGDKITKINNQKVRIQEDLVSQKYVSSDTTTVEYLRGSDKKTVTIDNAVHDIGYIGVLFKSDGESYTNEINMVYSGSPATKADIKAGDRIVSVDNIATPDSSVVVSIVRENPSKELSFKIDRNGEIITKNITPNSKKYFELGVSSTSEAKTSIYYAWAKSYNNVSAIVGSYIDLFRGKVQVTDMSGIVGIGEVVSKTSGILEYLNLIGIISLAIGVANVMPFPPLDGGKIVIVICEAITRRKLPLKAEAIISYIGFGLLILLTIVVTYNDILRVF